MEPFSFLHCADIHLDSPLQGLPIRDDVNYEQACSEVFEMQHESLSKR